jgi:hypothetical protein
MPSVMSTAPTQRPPTKPTNVEKMTSGAGMMEPRAASGSHPDRKTHTINTSHACVRGRTAVAEGLSSDSILIDDLPWRQGTCE